LSFLSFLFSFFFEGLWVVVVVVVVVVVSFYAFKIHLFYSFNGFLSHKSSSFTV